MKELVKRETVLIKDVVDGKAESPIDIGVIPNYMGINLCSVESISFTKLNDGQLIELTFNFIPSDGE